eukprot:UN14377
MIVDLHRDYLLNTFYYLYYYYSRQILYYYLYYFLLFGLVSGFCNLS